MSQGARATGGRRPAVAGAAFVVAAGLIAGCSGSGSTSSSTPSTLACGSEHGTAVTGTAPTAPTAPAATGQPAAGWTLPDATLANTRDVASAITSTNVSKLGVAWTVPLKIPTAHTDGAYATTPVIVNGVVYTANNHAAVALNAATGAQLWSRTLIGNDHEGIDMAPGYDHGTVYVSTVPVT